MSRQVSSTEGHCVYACVLALEYITWLNIWGMWGDSQRSVSTSYEWETMESLQLTQLGEGLLQFPYCITSERCWCHKVPLNSSEAIEHLSWSVPIMCFVFWKEQCVCVRVCARTRVCVCVCVWCVCVCVQTAQVTVIGCFPQIPTHPTLLYVHLITARGASVWMHWWQFVIPSTCVCVALTSSQWLGTPKVASCAMQHSHVQLIAQDRIPHL